MLSRFNIPIRRFCINIEHISSAHSNFSKKFIELDKKGFQNWSMDDLRYIHNKSSLPVDITDHNRMRNLYEKICKRIHHKNCNNRIETKELIRCVCIYEMMFDYDFRTFDKHPILIDTKNKCVKSLLSSHTKVDSESSLCLYCLENILYRVD